MAKAIIMYRWYYIIDTTYHCYKYLFLIYHKLLKQRNH